MCVRSTQVTATCPAARAANAASGRSGRRAAGTASAAPTTAKAGASSRRKSWIGNWLRLSVNVLRIDLKDGLSRSAVRSALGSVD